MLLLEIWAGKKNRFQNHKLKLKRQSSFIKTAKLAHVIVALKQLDVFLMPDNELKKFPI